eukprot:TRINITY_DN8405_c0_g1_i1.p1 TRINITY_DN8405_c0_g1~~TRINITY_DN8405_c0_g1_i1.p1  ORF type:complete len:1201 (+),score=338.03 TRINITY_DN8405_c0_g1_i1:120-3722(+)
MPRPTRALCFSCTARLAARQRSRVAAAAVGSGGESVQSEAARLLDAEARALADPQQADRLRTNLVDQLQVSEDAGERWQEEWRDSERQQNAESRAAADRLEQWQRGELQAGSRETARERDERRYQGGEWESSRLPPHPPEFESVLRKVRYAHIMPLPEAPAGTHMRFIASDAAALLPSLVDRLLDIRGVTLERLAELPLEEHDRLLVGSYTPATDRTVVNALEVTDLDEAVQLFVDETSEELRAAPPVALPAPDDAALASPPADPSAAPVAVDDAAPAPPPAESSAAPAAAAPAEPQPSGAAAAPAPPPEPAKVEPAEAEPAEAEPAAAPPPAAVTESAGEVFAGQERLQREADETFPSARESAASAASRPGTQARGLQPRRSPERTLTATQTLTAVADLCGVTRRSHEFWELVIPAAGDFGDRKYLDYYWGVLCREIPARKRHASVWNRYMRALGTLREVLGAYNTVEEMKELGITPTVQTWNELMRAYRLSGDSSSAIQVSDNMKMYAGVEPDHWHFFELMSAHGSDVSVDPETGARRCMNIFYEMTQVYRLEPLRNHYHAVLKALQPLAVNADFYLELTNYAQQMKHVGMPWSIAVYVVLLRAEAVRGDLGRVRELFVTMRRRKLPVTSQAFAAVLHAYGAAIPPPTDDRKEDQSLATSPGTFQWARKAAAEWARKHSAPFPWDEKRRELYAEAREVYAAAVAGSADGRGASRVLLAGLLRATTSLQPLLLRKVWEEDVVPQMHTRDWREPSVLAAYIRGLAHLSLIGDVAALDDAEREFVALARRGVKPTYSTYTSLMFAHVHTGRQGSVDIALDYMRALERAGYAVRSSTVKRFKQLVDLVGPKRDAIRRAQGLMERREGIRKELAERFAQPTAVATSPRLRRPGDVVRGVQGLTPDGFAFPDSLTGVNPDGTLVGEKPEERAAALAQMGHQPMPIRDSQQLREDDKVAGWLRHVAQHPHASLSPEHPAFDKILSSPHFRKLAAPQHEAAMNPWHAERLAEHPEHYDPQTGAPSAGEHGPPQDGDSAAAMLHSVRQTRTGAADFDLSRPAFSPAYAHTAADPAAWTPNQAEFMRDWTADPAGAAQGAAAERARRLREEMAVQRRLREERHTRDEQGTPYPDEEYAPPPEPAEPPGAAAAAGEPPPRPAKPRKPRRAPRPTPETPPEQPEASQLGEGAPRVKRKARRRGVSIPRPL